MLLITAEAHAGLNVHKAKHSQDTGEFSRTRLLGRNQKYTKPKKQQIKSFSTNHSVSLLPSPEKWSNQPQHPTSVGVWKTEVLETLTSFSESLKISF